MTTSEPASEDADDQAPLAFQIAAELIWLLVYCACYPVGLCRRLGDAPKGSRTPVVLVGGLLGRSISFFRLRRALQAAGHPVYAPDFGFQVGDIAEKARQLDEFIAARQLRDYYLVGHSMGGFIVADLPDETLRRARHVLTLGTGFGGAWTAYPFCFLPGPRMMAPGSSFRRRSVARVQSCDHWTIVRPWFDEVVIPTSAGAVEGCREIVVPQLGHIQLVMSRRSIDLIVDRLSTLEADSRAADEEPLRQEPTGVSTSGQQPTGQQPTGVSTSAS